MSSSSLESAESKIEKSLVNALQTLVKVETSLEGGGGKALQPTPENLETQLTSFIVNLKELHACGNSSYFELPIEFLEFIEEKPSVVNPGNTVLKVLAIDIVL